MVGDQRDEEGGDQPDVVVEGHPGGNVVVAHGEVEELPALVDAGGQVPVGDHHALWLGGGPGGVLQIDEIVRAVAAEDLGALVPLRPVGIDASEGHRLEEGLPQQRGRHLRVGGSLHPLVGDEKARPARLEHRDEARELARIDGRRNHREHHARQHTAEDRVDRPRVLHRQDDRAVPPLRALAFEVGGDVRGAGMELSHRHNVLPERLGFAVQKIVDGAVGVFPRVTPQFFQDSLHRHFLSTIGMSVFLPHANRGPLIRPLFAALVSAELWKCRVER